MSINLDVQSAQDLTEDAVLHSIPCHIEHNGPAPVQKYFISNIQNTEKDGMTASFRGRPLDGRVVEVPSGYTGIILHEPRQTFNEDDERKLKVTHKFKKFTHWNLDMKPSENDKIHKMLQWFDLAKEVHKRVPTSEDEASGSRKSIVDQ